MDLVIKADTYPPVKADWHNPDPKSRAGWSDIYEMITTWFCSSHDFNHADNICIIYNDYLIKMEGETIRYLGPSLRSAASLVSKAFAEINDLDSDEIIESTPGIFVHGSLNLYNFAEPFTQLTLVSSSGDISTSPPVQGTIFTFDWERSQEYYAPGSRLAQGIVWYLQER